MRWLFARGVFFGFGAGAALMLASCGPPTDRIPETGATLEGTIKYGTEDILFALVIVVNDKASATGKVREDGSYKVENCPLGEVKVAVNTPAGMGDYKTATMSKTYKGPNAKGGKKPDIKHIDIPKAYHDPSTTTLKTNVVAGANTYDITIPK